MTIGGAISDLNNLLKADDIPIYYKPSIKKVIETIEQEPCEDAVSRDNALACLTGNFDADITVEELISVYMKRIKKLPSVQPTSTPCEYAEDCKKMKFESCEDAVSREAALEVVNNPLNIKLDKIIEKLPSVTPTRAKGKWVWDSFFEEYACSCCYSGSDTETHFCPNCGAEMEGESK